MLLQTATFKKYWERGPALLGGKLVYNTGRHLEKYKDLYKEKSGCMAHPDVLICSVGTRVGGQALLGSFPAFSLRGGLPLTAISPTRCGPRTIV